MLTPTSGTLADYNSAVLAGNATHARVVFPVQNVTLHDNDISIDGGIEVSSYIVAEEDLTIGKAVMTEVKINFINSSVFTGFDWTEEFHLDFGVEISGTTNWKTIGYFKGNKPERTVRTDVIEFTAYDRMQLFDVLADDFLTTVTYPVTLGTLYSNLCTYVGLSSTAGNEIADSMLLSFDECPFTNGVSCRAILAWIAEANCCNAVITDSGNVKLKWFTDCTSSYSIDETKYFGISIREENVSLIDSVRISSTEDNVTGFIYPVSPTTNVYNIIDNPFLLTIGTADKTAFITAMISRFTTLGTYTPTSISAIGNWMVETGDIIEVGYDNGSTMNMPVFNRALLWAGSCEDTYECTGNTTRKELTETAKEQYEIGGKLSNKYTIQSGVDIDEDGVTVSGGKYVKIESGGVLDVQSSNFTIDSDTGVVESGNWKFDDDGLSVREEVTYLDQSLVEHTDIYDMYFGKNTLEQGATNAIYFDKEYIQYDHMTKILPIFVFGALGNSSRQLRFGFGRVVGKVYPDSDPGEPAIIPSVDDVWILGDTVKRFQMAYINKLAGDCVQNNLTTTDPYYALDARQGKVVNDKINGKSIASNTDLDTLTTPGRYYCNSGTIAATLVHSVNTNGGFDLDVIRRSDAYVTQIIHTNSNAMFVRRQGSDGFSTWDSYIRASSFAIDDRGQGTAPKAISKGQYVSNLGNIRVANKGISNGATLSASSGGNLNTPTDGALNDLNDNKFNAPTVQNIANNGSYTFALNNNKHYLLLINSFSNTARAIDLVVVGGSGTVRITHFTTESTGITYTTSTANQLKIANSSGQGCNCYLFLLN